MSVTYPDAGDPVHGHGAYRIVHLQAVEERDSEDGEQAAHRADYDGLPRPHHRATRYNEHTQLMFNLVVLIVCKVSFL